MNIKFCELMASVKCERCCYPDGIVAYVVRSEGHCVCPQCDHVWVELSENAERAPLQPGREQVLKDRD